MISDDDPRWEDCGRIQEVSFIGGHWDKQWKTVDTYIEVIRVALPLRELESASERVTNYSMEIQEYRRITYRHPISGSFFIYEVIEE